MKKSQFAWFLLTLPACAASSTTSSSTSAITSAVPKSEWIDVQSAIQTPLPSEVAAAPALPATCAGGPPAMFAAMSSQVMTGANGPVTAVLSLVSAVTQSPPAVMTPDHAVWGPLTSPGDPLVHRLDIALAAPGVYHFVLSGKPVAAGDDAWIGVFQGDIAPAADHAEGDVEIDLGAIHSLDANSLPSAGGILIHFAASADARGIDEVFSGIVDPATSQPNDAHYTLQQDANGAAFDFQTRTDFDHDGTADELLDVQARFLADGEGKASTTVTGGNLGSATVGAIECWDDQQRVLFYGDDMNANPPAGDPGCCIM